MEFDTRNCFQLKSSEKRSLSMKFEANFEGLINFSKPRLTLIQFFTNQIEFMRSKLNFIQFRCNLRQTKHKTKTFNV